MLTGSVGPASVRQCPTAPAGQRAIGNGRRVAAAPGGGAGAAAIWKHFQMRPPVDGLHGARTHNHKPTGHPARSSDAPSRRQRANRPTAQSARVPTGQIASCHRLAFPCALRRSAACRNGLKCQRARCHQPRVPGSAWNFPREHPDLRLPLGHSEAHHVRGCIGCTGESPYQPGWKGKRLRVACHLAGWQATWHPPFLSGTRST